MSVFDSNETVGIEGLVACRGYLVFNRDTGRVGIIHTSLGLGNWFERELGKLGPGRKDFPRFEVFIFGHIGDGNLHVFLRQPADLHRAVFLAECKASDAALFGFVRQFRGSVSAEHGIGVLKREALQYSRSPAELALLRRIKAAFDPDGLLNPGKVI